MDKSNKKREGIKYCSKGMDGTFTIGVIRMASIKLGEGMRDEGYINENRSRDCKRIKKR
jgi:hypothetical protein